MHRNKVLFPHARTVIAFDGPSGAGKTTLAHRLADTMRSNATSVTVIGMDDLYRGWSGLEAGVDVLLHHVLTPYSGTAQILQVPTWDWHSGAPGPSRVIPAPGLLIVEGVGCGALRCAPLLSLLVWVDAPAPVRRRRALERDGEMYRPHWHQWATLEHAHFDRERTHERAEVAIGLP